MLLIPNFLEIHETIFQFQISAVNLYLLNMNKTIKVQNNILHNFGHVHIFALISNWHAKVESLFNVHLELHPA